MEAPIGARFREDRASLTRLSLDARLGVFRRRRRITYLKRVMSIGPLLAGMSILLLVAFAGTASFR